MAASEAMKITSTISLRSGTLMPMFGLGTWLSTGDGTCADSVTAALRNGYPLIDTAQMYENEEDVGNALKGKNEIFVVSKLNTSCHGAEKTREAVNESLRKLQRERIDLYLIHSPKPGKVVETWRTLLELKQEGKIKEVGVSNFGVGQLQGLKESGLEVPAVNQIEYHLHLPQTETVEYCKSEGIAVMGYCPLARCKHFGHEIVQNLVSKYEKTEAQIYIRWSLQTGVITIPKSSNVGRIQQNAEVFDFELDESDVSNLAKLNDGFKASNAVNSMDIPWEDVR